MRFPPNTTPSSDFVNWRTSANDDGCKVSGRAQSEDRRPDRDFGPSFGPGEAMRYGRPNWKHHGYFGEEARAVIDAEFEIMDPRPLSRWQKLQVRIGAWLRS